MTVVIETATTAHRQRDQTPLTYAVSLGQHVCHVAGPLALVENLRSRRPVVRAIARHDTPALFGSLMHHMSYQGIADRAADNYIARHGNVTWADVATGLSRRELCPKLSGYAAFKRCDYVKNTRTCANPSRLTTCPVPTHPLRNGRLNQIAYSLHLFLRDVAGGDLVGWIDQRLTAAASGSRLQLHAMRAALVEPMRSIYGVSDKLLAMVLSDLLLTGSRHKYWREVGVSFVVVDSLVHNFLHRTGILRRLGADHAYGPACYRPGGCADALYTIADYIDVSALNPGYPKIFPRFVQLAIWRYCTENGVNVCNGNRIDDRSRCDNIYCRLYRVCDRISLGTKPLLQSN
jgi:hypothetical protein